MKISKIISTLTFGLLFLILLEGLFTMGKAFEFEKYNIIAWIAQLLGVAFTVSFSLYIYHKSEQEG